MNMTLADNIRAERNRRRMTQTQLDAAAGLTRDSVSLIERGLRDPHISDLYAIAGALGIRAHDLLPSDPAAVLETAAA